jgi:hypothetical protein
MSTNDFKTELAALLKKHGKDKSIDEPPDQLADRVIKWIEIMEGNVKRSKEMNALLVKENVKAPAKTKVKTKRKKS